MQVEQNQQQWEAELWAAEVVGAVERQKVKAAWGEVHLHLPRALSVAPGPLQLPQVERWEEGKQMEWGVGGLRR